MKINMTSKDGVILLTQGKYCTENIEVTPTFETGGGTQPQLFAPTVAFDSVTTILTITDTQNGSFPVSYDVYANGTKLTNATIKTVNILNASGSFDGTKEITVKTVAENFKDSESSNAVVWELYAPTISIEDLTITITDTRNNASIVTGYDLYVNDVFKATLTAKTVDLTSYNLVDGDTVKVCTNAGNGLVSAFSNVIIRQRLYATFGDNSWSQIATAFKNGNVPSTWAVGDTKAVTLSNGETYTIRLCDMQENRYAYTDGSGGNKAVFEFVELQTTSRYMNSTNTNVGGWADCYMRNTVMGEIYALLPTALQEVISEVEVLSGIGNSNTTDTSTSSNKLFLPAVLEIYSSDHNSIGLAECPLGQFDYYKANNTSSAKVKKKLGDTSSTSWWCRSPYKLDSNYFCYVHRNGDNNFYNANYANGVAPVFAI